MRNGLFVTFTCGLIVMGVATHFWGEHSAARNFGLATAWIYLATLHIIDKHWKI